MVRSILLFAFLSLPFYFISSREAKALDPYKVLGVDKNAGQRDIQKAFHKLSLQYHPDKNKNKAAQEKFAEINNAYEILSDEDKRKTYDLHGDEKGNTRFDGGMFGNHEGYTYFTSGGPGVGHFTSGPGGWQTMGSQGNARSFSYSFRDEPSANENQFGFDIGDMFSNIFGGGISEMKGHNGGSHHGSFSTSGARSNSGSVASGNIEDINLQSFNKKIRDQGLTWLLLFYTPARGYHVLESVTEDATNSLRGAVKAGKVNCQSEQALCRDLGLLQSRSARLFVYTYASNEKGSLLEYNGEFDSRSVKIFCQDHLPRISRRIDIGRSKFPITNDKLPEVLLLSTRKDTPVIWRVISGLYRKRFTFYDAEVHDLSHPFLKKFGIEELPALVGRLSNGDVQVLKAGVSVKDILSGINELKALLENFERKNKETHAQGKNIPFLTFTNMDSLCGDKTPVCVIGVFRSQKARENLEAILSVLSRKMLARIQRFVDGFGDVVSYSLLDANKQSQFLNSFHSSEFKSLGEFLLAYKPRKRKFAVLTGELSVEEAEKFVSSVLSGDVIFSKIPPNHVFL